MPDAARTDADAPTAPSSTFPTSLSPSRASDYTTCPLLFRFRSIDRLPEEPSASAVRGTVVHRALEWLFDLPAPDRDRDAARVLLARALTELEEVSPREADVLRPAPDAPPQVDAEHLLEGYFALEDPQRLEPHAREVRVSAQLEQDFEVRGFVDRVDVSPEGLVRIVDYKTGRAPSEAYAGGAMFQMRFYALTWWRMTGQVPRMLQLMYLGDARTLRHEPDEDDLRATERRILALRGAISRAADAGRFDPSPSRLCDWCSFRALCPAKGGTLPPLPPREEWQTAISTRRGRSEPAG